VARLRLGLHGCNRPAKTISPLSLRAHSSRDKFFSPPGSPLRCDRKRCSQPVPRRPDHNKDAMGANLVQPKGEFIMANIGTFTADKDGFTGTLRTLTLNVKVKLVPNDKGDNENAPDFRLQAAGPRHRRGVEEDQRGRAALPVRDPRRSFVPGNGLCPPDRRRGRHARPDLVAQQAPGGLTAAQRPAHCGGALCC
jgi:hypothetical protein